MSKQASRVRLFTNGAKLNQFQDLQGFRDRIAKLDTVAPEPVYRRNGDMVEQYKALAYEGSGRVATVVGKNYTVYQTKDVLSQAADALEDLNAQPRGYVEESQRGGAVARVFFQNPDYAFAPNTTATDGDMVGLGLAFKNSYGEPAMAVSSEGMGIRKICGNFNLWGDILGRASVRHVGQVKAAIQSHVKDLAKGIPFLEKRVLELDQFRLTGENEILQALRGLGVGPRTSETVMENGFVLEKSWTKNPSLWTVYNALTAFATHRDHAESGLESELRRATKLFVAKDFNQILATGREAMKEVVA